MSSIVWGFCFVVAFVLIILVRKYSGECRQLCLVHSLKTKALGPTPLQMMLAVGRTCPSQFGNVPSS
jgi:hypothetical protein